MGAPTPSECHRKDDGEHGMPVASVTGVWKAPTVAGSTAGVTEKNTSKFMSIRDMSADSGEKCPPEGKFVVPGHDGCYCVQICVAYPTRRCTAEQGSRVPGYRGNGGHPSILFWFRNTRTSTVSSMRGCPVRNLPPPPRPSAPPPK